MSPTCARTGNWGLSALGVPASSSSAKALASCMTAVPAWRRLRARRLTFAGDSRSSMTSGGPALSCLGSLHVEVTSHES